MRRLWTLTRFLTGFVILLGWSMGRPQELGAQEVCTIAQLTNSLGRSFEPTINADGTRITFFSPTDLVGQNPDGYHEIFLFDTAANTLTQLTDSPDESSRVPFISADGTRIVFESRANLTGQNPEGTDALFLLDTTTTTFTQLTEFHPSRVDDTATMAINADGTRIAFMAAPAARDSSNAVFLFDTTTNTLTQLTDFDDFGSTSHLVISINADGTRIAFQFDGDLTGQNADGNDEIFLLDTTTNTLTQVTDTRNGFTHAPYINADGTRIAFTSSADLTGQNADGNDEIFLLDTTTNTLTQVTDTRNGFTHEPSINADGTRIAFYSSANLTGENPDNNEEVFLLETTTNTLTQVTNSTGDNRIFLAIINADGTRIVFESEGDLVLSSLNFVML